MCHSALPELGGCSASVSHWDRVTPSLEGPAHSGDIPPTRAEFLPFQQQYHCHLTQTKAGFRRILRAEPLLGSAASPGCFLLLSREKYPPILAFEQGKKCRDELP